MRKKPLNVCFVTEDFYPNFIGGGGIYAWRLTLELVTRGVSLTVLAEQAAGRREHWRECKAVRFIPTSGCRGNPLVLAVFQYVVFRRRLSCEHFDILHATQLSGLFFVLLPPKNVKHIVITVHHTYRDMYEHEESRWKRFLYVFLMAIEGFLYRRAPALLFHTHYERDKVMRDYGITHARVGVAPLGVDLPTIARGERVHARRTVRACLGLPADSRIVLYVGRLVRRKRVETILGALRLLPSGVHSLIIGTGRDGKRLVRLAPHNAHILGYVPDTRRYFLAADVFVLPSVAEGGVALSVLEAASFGLPLVVSRSAAYEPIIQEGNNGYIVDPDNEEELAQKLRLALRYAHRFGALSRLAAGRLGWKRCVDATGLFYRSLLGKTDGSV